MSRDHRILERHFRHWREKRLLTPDLEGELRKSSAELDRSSASNIMRNALAALGSGLLLAGLVLIVAENWGAIPASVKLGTWAALQCAFLYLAYELGVRFGERPFLGEAFAFVAGGWVLGGIALVSQIYHLDSRPPNGIWLWLALVLPAAWLIERRATAAVVFVALTTALTLEVGTDDSWLHAERTESPWLPLAIPVLAAAAVSWLPHPASYVRGWVGAWVFGAANIFLLVFGTEQWLARTTLGGAWFLVGAAMLVGLAQPSRCLPPAWDGLVGRSILVLSILPWALVGSRYDGAEWIDLTAVGLSWVVQLALAVLVIRAGARGGSAIWVNLGYLALLAGILTRYFDFFGEYLEGGVALAGTGVLLLFILYALEKARRRTLTKEVWA